MGYYGIGSEPIREAVRGGKWVDSTNPATKNHVVRVAIGTADRLEYLHSANDLHFGVLQTTGTYNEWLDVATEGVVICVNSKAGTISLGDPVMYDHSNSGGTCGKVMSGVVLDKSVRGYTGTGPSVGTYWVDVPQPITYPMRPGSVRFGTSQEAPIILPEGGSGTVFLVDGAVSQSGLVDTPFHYMIDYPVIGYALDKANSPGDELRVKLAREHNMKTNAAW